MNDEEYFDPSDRTPSSQAKRGSLCELNTLGSNTHKWVGHQMRIGYFRKFRDSRLDSLKPHQMVDLRDYESKLETYTFLQGTAEKLGQKLSNHSNVITLRNPTTDIRFHTLK